MDIPRRKGFLHHTSMQSVLLIRNAPHSFSQRTGGLVWQQNISPNAPRWLPILLCRVPAQPHTCPCPRGPALTPFPACGSCRLPNPSLHLAMKALPGQCLLPQVMRGATCHCYLPTCATATTGTTLSPEPAPGHLPTAALTPPSLPSSSLP